jgi:hypothetical protein
MAAARAGGKFRLELNLLIAHLYNIFFNLLRRPPLEKFQKNTWYI